MPTLKNNLPQNLFRHDGADCVNEVFEDAMSDAFPNISSVTTPDK